MLKSCLHDVLVAAFSLKNLHFNASDLQLYNSNIILNNLDVASYFDSTISQGEFWRFHIQPCLVFAHLNIFHPPKRFFKLKLLPRTSSSSYIKLFFLHINPQQIMSLSSHM